MIKRIVILLFFIQVSLGQTKAGLELCIQYQNSFSGFTTEIEAYEALDKILNVIGASKNFTLVPCDDISNALAVTFKGERFILFDGEFMRKITQLTNNWANLFILAHEVGHHINGHTRDFLLATVLDDQSLADRRKEELEADEFASFIVSKLGASYAQIEETIDLIASNESDQYSTHPSYDKRIAAVKKGFDRAYSSSGTSNSNSTTNNKNSTKATNTSSGDLVPNTNKRRLGYGLKFGNWRRSVYYGLENSLIERTSDGKRRLITDPFKIEELKQEIAIKSIYAESFGKSLSPYGSKNIHLGINIKYFTYDQNKNNYFFIPRTSFDVSLSGFNDIPKEITFNYDEFEPNQDLYATFQYIIDGKYSGEFVCQLKGWYKTYSLKDRESFEYKSLDKKTDDTWPLALNGYMSKYFEKEKYEFIERLKSGKKLYLRFGKLFYWNGYLNSGSEEVDGAEWDTSRINSDYDIPKYTYEFDLTGSSKALRLIE